MRRRPDTNLQPGNFFLESTNLLGLGGVQALRATQGRRHFFHHESTLTMIHTMIHPIRTSTPTLLAVVAVVACFFLIVVVLMALVVLASLDLLLLLLLCLVVLVSHPLFLRNGVHASLAQGLKSFPFTVDSRIHESHHVQEPTGRIGVHFRHNVDLGEFQHHARGGRDAAVGNLFVVLLNFLFEIVTNNATELTAVAVELGRQQDEPKQLDRNRSEFGGSNLGETMSTNGQTRCHQPFVTVLGRFHQIPRSTIGCQVLFNKLVDLCHEGFALKVKRQVPQNDNIGSVVARNGQYPAVQEIQHDFECVEFFGTLQRNVGRFHGVFPAIGVKECSEIQTLAFPRTNHGLVDAVGPHVPQRRRGHNRPITQGFVGIVPPRQRFGILSKPVPAHLGHKEFR